MNQTNEALWSTAYHEAGHCVVGLVTGDRPTKASIVAGDNYEGATWFEEDTGTSVGVDDPPREASEWYIIRSLAGALAEQRYTGGGADPSACDDYARASDLLARLSAEPERLHAALAARTEAILDEHWPAVERVAAALVEHLTIDEHTIRSVARVKGVAASG